MGNFLFYKFFEKSQTFYSEEEIDKFECFLWSTGILRIIPDGISWLPFGVWWLFDRFHIFANHNYALFLIYDENKLVHRSCVFPKYFRFPFMQKDDLQIGDTWTHPEYRGQGLATFAIWKILRNYHKPGRHFWYVVEENNKASIRVIEKSGFSLVGKGVRTKHFGISLLGSFELQEKLEEKDLIESLEA